MKDPYSVLGLPKGTDPAELTARYEELKAKYSEDRFLTGEAGNEAARNLNDLETAWATISAEKDKQEAKATFGGDFGQVDDLIKRARYDEAQSMLDSISDRTAEWHYLQSIIFYKREWLTESRKQLAMAVDMEPRNDKYKNALEKMDMVMGNPGANAQNLGVDQNAMNQQQQQPGPNDPMMAGNCLSNCCCAYCLTDCCCNMMHCCS